MFRAPVNRSGFTLIEVLMVCVILSVALFSLRKFRSSTSDDVDGQARLFMLAVQGAHAQAVLRGGRVTIDIVPGQDESIQDAYRIQHRDPDADTIISSEWKTLGQNVRFDIGAARYGPLGDSAAVAVPLDTVSCDATGICDLEGAPIVTFYFASEQDPTAVRAVTLTSIGTLQLYRYRSNGEVWQSGRMVLNASSRGYRPSERAGQ